MENDKLCVTRIHMLSEYQEEGTPRHGRHHHCIDWSSLITCFLANTPTSVTYAQKVTLSQLLRLQGHVSTAQELTYKVSEEERGLLSATGPLVGHRFFAPSGVPAPLTELGLGS